MKNLKKIISVTAAAAMVMSTVAPVSVFADDATFKIGGIGPVTGAAAIYGQAVKNATELAINEVNEDGGINGYQVEFKFEDDENDAEKTLNAYNALKDWGMNVLVGTVTSTPCVAVANETAADNMFQLTPSGSATECVANPNVFRVCFSDPNQGTAAAQYIGEHKLATKVAIIYDSSDVYSSGITQNFTAEAANQGIEIVSSEAFTADNNKDFSVQLQKAKDGGAELVFLPIYYTEASLILAQQLLQFPAELVSAAFNNFSGASCCEAFALIFLLEGFEFHVFCAFGWSHKCCCPDKSCKFVRRKEYFFHFVFRCYVNSCATSYCDAVAVGYN